MKWSMWVWDTKTASMGSRSGAGVRSMRPRSTRSARPCQRRLSRSAGSPVWPFSKRGRNVDFMCVSILESAVGARQPVWPGRSLAAIRGGRVPGAARAARVPLAIASGALRREIELILAHAGLTAAFTAIVSAEDVEEGKPSPEAFRCALGRLRDRVTDLAPEHCLVIEDSRPGVEAARRAGMRCLAVTNSYSATELADADLVVQSLAGIGWERLEALF